MALTKEEVDCPKCHGQGGFVEFSVNGKEKKKKPCSADSFRKYENNFIEILTEV